MSLYFQIKKDIAVRKEYFGCICCDLSTGEYFQYNTDAFKLLSELSCPIRLDSLLVKLRKEGYSISYKIFVDFITDLIVNGIVEEKKNVQKIIYLLFTIKRKKISRLII